MFSRSVSITFRKALRGVSRADIFSYSLIYLMLLLIIGTLFQKQIGVYAAEKIYFSSYLIWIKGVFPVPGTKSILTFIFFSLLARLILEKWVWKKAGSILLHLGALLLLSGGFITSKFSQEGSMIIEEGKETNYISDYYDYELAIINLSSQDYDEVTSFNQGWLRTGNLLVSTSLPFQVKVKEFIENISLLKRETIEENASYGIARIYQFEHRPLEKVAERNKAGLVFEVKGGDEEANGNYLVFEGMPLPQYIYNQGKRYQVLLRHKRTYLPFSIKLLDFQYARHPGTGIAREYQSEIIIKDQKNTLWQSLIRMNRPVRYKGYTFYQSSFEETIQQTTTVLAVVRNTGRLFPYISGFVMIIGLLFHLIQRLPSLGKKKAVYKKSVS